MASWNLWHTQARVRMPQDRWFSMDDRLAIFKTLIMTNPTIRNRYHFILMRCLTKKKSKDRFASRHPQQRIKTGPLGLQVSHVIRTLYPANTEQMYLRQMTAENTSVRQLSGLSWS